MHVISRHRNVLVETICLLFIILFVYAGLTKFLEGDLFYHNILNSPIFGSEIIAGISSWVIPIIEILAGLLLTLPKTRIKTLYLVLGLLILYTVYLVGILYFSAGIPCTCRTFFHNLNWNQHLYFNTGCLLLVIITIFLTRKKTKNSFLQKRISKYFVATKAGKKSRKPDFLRSRHFINHKNL